MNLPDVVHTRYMQKSDKNTTKKNPLRVRFMVDVVILHSFRNPPRKANDPCMIHHPPTEFYWTRSSVFIHKYAREPRWSICTLCTASTLLFFLARARADSSLFTHRVKILSPSLHFMYIFWCCCCCIIQFYFIFVNHDKQYFFSPLMLVYFFIFIYNKSRCQTKSEAKVITKFNCFLLFFRILFVNYRLFSLFSLLFFLFFFIHFTYIQWSQIIFFFFNFILQRRKLFLRTTIARHLMCFSAQ